MTVMTPPVQTRFFARASDCTGMIRSPVALKSRVFDVLVIGGGIYGAWAAYDAAQRGLSVALIEQNDFGSGTSSNSQKIIHGGLRYLQHGDLQRFRESVCERRTLLCIAPHLVSPMPVLVPLYRGMRPGRVAMRAALKLNDLLSADRNSGLLPSQHIPPGRMVSRSECFERFRYFDDDRLIGGGMFYDAQILNPERLLIQVLQAAVRCGAEVANRMPAIAFCRSEQRIAGVRAIDKLSGEELTIRAHTTLNCTGPWLSNVLMKAGCAFSAHEYPTFTAIVLVTRSLAGTTAVSLPGARACAGCQDRKEILAKGYRNYFITPWRDCSLVGTFYRRNEYNSKSIYEQVDDLLIEFNQVSHRLQLQQKDVFHVYVGRLPQDPRATATDFQYAKRYRILDHETEHSLPGLISVMGVKWTTARHVAERAIDIVMRKLNRRVVPCRTAEVQLQNDLGSGGELDVSHALQQEMAHSLADVVFRRTDIATAGHPGEEVLNECAERVATAAGWDESRKREEMNAVDAVFQGLGRRGYG